MTVGRIAFAAPWSAEETRHGYDRVIRDAKRNPIALACVAGWDKHSAAANARLIAAAPDLLRLLKWYVAACKEQGLKLGSITGDAETVIAKAEGEK